ncbi:jg15823, partial [Pararge aegeria aegeria]
AAAPVKEVPKRGGRSKKIVEEESASKEAEPEETAKPARRKRKVDVDETTIKEAPAKRPRATRAAAALGN